MGWWEEKQKEAEYLASTINCHKTGKEAALFQCRKSAREGDKEAENKYYNIYLKADANLQEAIDKLCKLHSEIVERDKQERGVVV